MSLNRLVFVVILFRTSGENRSTRGEPTTFSRVVDGLFSQTFSTSYEFPRIMLVELLFVLFLIWLTRHVIMTYLERKGMPPGPFPYPLIGNIPQLMCDPVDPYTKLAEKYGDIFTVTTPGVTAVAVSTASLARQAKIERHDDFAGRLPGSLYPLDEILGNDLAMTDYSPKYQFRRRVFKSAIHVFGSGIEKVSEVTKHTVDSIMEDIETRNGKSFCPRVLLGSSVMALLWEWLTSNKVKLDDKIIQGILEFNDLLLQRSLHSTLHQLLPFSSYLPTQYNRDIERAKQIKNDIFPPEYRSHMETFTPGVVRDLTDSFISAYKKEIAKESNKDIGSMDDIPNLMLDVLFAGSDSTSTSLSWLILFLLRNPDVQEKIHKEIDDVVGNDRLPTWSDVHSMPYIQATLCEVQRASGLVGRSGTNTIRDTTLAGYHIPKGTLVLYNFPQLHNDEREWPEPKTFRPERFLDSDGKFVGWSKVHGFLPFGGGRRECPGQSLAKVMMFTIASNLLQRYKFEIPEGEGRPTAERSTSAVLNAPVKFHVVAKKRGSFKH